MNDEFKISISDHMTPQTAANQVPVIISNSMAALEKIQKRMSEARQKADKAKEDAKKAWSVEISIWRSDAPALEALQKAGKTQSEALVEMSECQALLLNQQYVLAQCTKYLFMLCCANLASARTAVHQIQGYLKGASEGKISDMARNELQKTLQQLKQQMDFLEQQEKLKEKVKKLEKMFTKSDSGQVLKKMNMIYIALVVFLFVSLCFGMGLFLLFLAVSK